MALWCGVVWSGGVVWVAELVVGGAGDVGGR